MTVGHSAAHLLMSLMTVGTCGQLLIPPSSLQLSGYSAVSLLAPWVFGRCRGVTRVMVSQFSAEKSSKEDFYQALWVYLVTQAASNVKVSMKQTGLSTPQSLLHSKSVD